MLKKKLTILPLILALLSTGFWVSAQTEFTPPTSSEDLLHDYQVTLRNNVRSIKRELPREHKYELKKFYNSRYEYLLALGERGHYFFHEDWNNYLRNISDKIMRVNSTYDFSTIQVVLSTYHSVNAVSMGEGTVVVNPGLVTQLQSEDQLAFVLCHEFAHVLLKHSDQRVVRLLEEFGDSEMEAILEDVSDREYYKRTEFLKQMRSKYYRMAHDSRKGELEADSLGWLLFNQTKYDPEAGLQVVRILENTNKKKVRQLDISALTGMEPMDFHNNELLGSVAYEEEEWLQMDSMMSHPNCSDRFNRLKTFCNRGDLDFNKYEVQGSTSDNFERFRSDMRYFMIECYLEFDLLDIALLTIWEYQQAGDSNEYLRKREFQTIANLVYARKKHHIGHVATRPHDSIEKSHRDLGSILFVTRFKTLAEQFSTLAMKRYRDTDTDEESLFALCKLAYARNDKNDLEFYKAEYFARFDRRSGKYYELVKYL